MATLTLTIGSLTSSATATNENAQAVLEAVFARDHPYDYDTFTDQEKLDWIVQEFLPAVLKDRAEQGLVLLADIEAQAGAPTFE